MSQLDPYSDEHRLGQPQAPPPRPAPIPPPDSGGFDDPELMERRLYVMLGAAPEIAGEHSWPTISLPPPDESVGSTDYLGNPSPPPLSGDADEMKGPFDAFSAEVLTVHYDDGAADPDPLYGTRQAIEAMRCDMRWGTNNDPYAAIHSEAWSGPTPHQIVAFPTIARHDQEEWHVEVGDIVTILAGKDGKHWYFNDELPFIGVVMQRDDLDEDATEDECGGAGNDHIQIRRQALNGDPSDGSFTHSDLSDEAGDYVEYKYVYPIGPDSMHHGYRCGDPIWCQRRGMYYFIEPCKQTLQALITNAGPDGEGDFSTNHYWVKEIDGTITYNENKWTSVWTIRPRADTVEDSEGRFGRWIDAENIEEPAGSHALPTDGSQRVLVHLYQDPAYYLPYYLFERQPPDASS